MDNISEPVVAAPVASKRNTTLIVALAITAITLIILIVIALVLVSNNRDSSQVSMLPVNTCPDEVTYTNERPTAVYNGKNAEMSLEVYNWVQANCEVVANNSEPMPQTPPASDRIASPVLYNLGIEFGPYDSSTGKAGDIVFSNDSLMSNWNTNKVFFEFGAQVDTPEGTKTLIEITYVQLDPNADILAMADGKVVNLNLQPETNDYDFSVIYNDYWVVEYDHLRDLRFEIGDNVKAGDVIGKPSLNRSGGTGFTEVSVKQTDGQTASTHYCPVDLLAEEVKDTILSQLSVLMNEWESYSGNQNIYDQASQTIPGCIVNSVED
jgi:hypothetical protein